MTGGKKTTGRFPRTKSSIRQSESRICASGKQTLPVMILDFPLSARVTPIQCITRGANKNLPAIKTHPELFDHCYAISIRTVDGE